MSEEIKKEPIEKSNCCNAPVEFTDFDKAGKKYIVCIKCKSRCNIKENPQNGGEKVERDKEGKFVEGHTKLGGKKKGSISVVSKIKEILKEVIKTKDGEERQKLELLARSIVNSAIKVKDKDMIKLIVQQIDGMPKTKIGLDPDDDIGEININIKKRNESN